MTSKQASKQASKQLHASIQLYAVSTRLLYMQSKKARAVAQQTLWHSIWHRLLAHTHLYFVPQGSCVHLSTWLQLLFLCWIARFVHYSQAIVLMLKEDCMQMMAIVWFCPVAANLCNKCVFEPASVFEPVSLIQGLCNVVVSLLFQRMP